MMNPTTKRDYEMYKRFFASFMRATNLANLSRSEACNESYVSSFPCAVCGDRQQGMRLDADGADKETHEVKEFVICEDCEYYAEYGRLPDAVMESIGI